jgi:hypothetical protein
MVASVERISGKDVGVRQVFLSRESGKRIQPATVSAAGGWILVSCCNFLETVIDI